MFCVLGNTLVEVDIIERAIINVLLVRIIYCSKIHLSSVILGWEAVIYPKDNLLMIYFKFTKTFLLRGGGQEEERGWS